MPEQTIAPYGAWESPVTTEMLTSGALRFVEIAADGEDVFWVESRPEEGGRYAAMRRTADGEINEVTPPEHSARTLVHEYGGGAFTAAEGMAYYSNFADQRLYRRPSDGSGSAEAITPESTPEGSLRYADAAVDAARGRLICVVEDHRGEGEAENYLAAVPVDGGEASPVHRGFDFYASPRISPDGGRLAWICWNHPRMPWDATELWAGELASDGTLRNARRIAGDAAGGESILEPVWGPDGALYCASDASGWWNIHRREGDGIVPVLRMEAEFSQPPWTFSSSCHAVLDERRLAVKYFEGGRRRIGVIDAAAGALREIPTPFSSFGYDFAAAGGKVIVEASGADSGAKIVAVDPDTGEFETLRAGTSPALDPGYVSEAEPISFPSADGRTAHGYYYAPRNADFRGAEGERPPLVTFTHGGPTSRTEPGFSLGVQYWTTRGFGVVDVNYGGSTGYGTAYRRLLNGNWGIVDVQDCAAAARYLVERGDVDPKRLAIRGGSAGGYTTLCALAFTDTFSAGASYYGVSDAAALAEETHKFESRYLDTLIGPYPERAELYEQRSAMHALDRFNCPILFLQGSEDKIVPPNQAERMVEALRRKGIPVAYLLFEGEQHGFRQAQNIMRAAEAELDFYGRIFGFTPAGEIEPVEIENL